MFKDGVPQFFPVFHVSMSWQYFIRHPGVLFMGSGVFPLFLEFLPGGLTIDIQTGQWINMVNVTSDCCTHPCSSPSLSFFLNTTASVGGAATYTREHFEHGRGGVFCTKLCDSCHICQTQNHIIPSYLTTGVINGLNLFIKTGWFPQHLIQNSRV